MSAEVFAHDLRSRRTTTAVVALVLGGLVLFVLSVASGLGDTLDQLTADFPEELLAFMGGGGPGNYVVSELFGLLAPAFIVAFAVFAGANASAGEEGDGTINLLAAQPVTRTRLLAAKSASAALTLVVVAGALLLGVGLGAAWFDVGLQLGGVAAACLHLLLLSLFYFAVALAVGAATGRPGWALGAGGGLAVLSYLLSSMLPLAGLDDWARLSPWFYYSGSEPLINGVDPVHLLVLAALSAVAVAVAFLTYPRRDLKG